jgi:type IV pilus assembly protein PilM
MFLSNSYLGMEFGTDYVRLAQARKKGRVVYIEKAGSEIFPEDVYNNGVIVQPEAVAEVIGNLWDRLGIKKKDVVISLGGPMLLFRILALPKMPPKELKVALYWELERYFPHLVSDMAYDYTVFKAKRSRKEDKVLVVAAPNHFVSGFLNTFNLLGIKVRAMEPEAISLLRFFNFHQEDRLLIAPRKTYTKLIIVVGNKLHFRRILPMGYEQIVNDLITKENKVNFSTSDNYGFIRECRRSVDFYQSQVLAANTDIKEIILWTGCAKSNGYLGEMLSAEFNWPVRDNFLGNHRFTWADKISRKNLREYAVAIGSALRR